MKTPSQTLADQLISVKSQDLLSKSFIEKLEFWLIAAALKCTTMVFYIDGGGELKRYHVYPSQLLSLILMRSYHNMEGHTFSLEGK